MKLEIEVTEDEYKNWAGQVPQRLIFKLEERLIKAYEKQKNWVEVGDFVKIRGYNTWNKVLVIDGDYLRLDGGCRWYTENCVKMPKEAQDILNREIACDNP